MRKIALISSFCDNEEKLNILKKNIKKIKSLGVDVMVISPLMLDEEIFNLVDYLIYTKENPVLNWPEKAYYQWWMGTINGKNIKMTTTYPDYGYAGLVQFKRMADYALSMEYEIFFPMIYDININEHVESIFKLNLKNSFFPSKRDGRVWGIGLHFISLDREYLVRFKNLITKESYLIESDFDAFAWLHRAVKLIPGRVEKTPVEDLIYFLENKDFFDLSLSNYYKCFIHKTNYDKMKIVFYNFGGVKNFLINIDSVEYQYDVREWEEITLDSQSAECFKITHNNEEIDYTKILNGIGQNTLEIL